MPRLVDSQAMAVLTHLKDAGNDMAEAIVGVLNNFKVVELTKDTEGTTAANTIRVSGQVKDLDGSTVSGAKDVMVRIKRGATGGTAVTGTVSTGTAKAGDASVDVWLQTTAAGAFAVDMLEDGVGDDLVEVSLDDGFTQSLLLTFA